LSRRADIVTMAVTLTFDGDQARPVLRKNQADLIVVGWEILNNPNWLMDKALKSGGRGLLTRP
jgi:2,4-dienoyl-CoA reductase-like NADH-dependent reductase (Old Yellow Enzyme family)